MKAIKYSLMGLALMAAGLTSCQDSFDAPDLQNPVATMQPNTTIAEIKQMIAMNYDGENDVVIKVGDKDEEGTHYIIHGRVISSDASGNIYQNLVIQDETAALTLSIREASMWTSFRVGQEVVFDATGLYMGTYSGLFQLGWLDEYNGGASMTFMSWFMFLEHQQKNGMPNQDFSYISINSEWPEANPYCFVTTIEELNSISSTSTLGVNVMSQLVEIQDVYFENGGKETFAEYQESNERRYVVDAMGNRIALNNSGYATFHNELLPEGMGSVRGILGYYQDEWQLTIRDIEDVMFDTNGNKSDPYTVEEAIAQNNNGRTGWTKGYIVGSVKGGISTVTSSADIVFGSEGEVDNNVVIAGTPDETDWTKCMVVQLPYGSLFREFVNVVDNAYLIGQQLNVRGTFQQYLGMHGIVDNGGGLSEFSIDGIDFSEGLGVGDEENPFTVSYMLKNSDPVNNIWVIGYIVGYVEGTDFATGARIGLPGDGANYNGANVIIAASPSETNIENCIPVRCDRNTVGLIRNPENLGKQVKFFGNGGEYLGKFGLSATTEAKFE